MRRLLPLISALMLVLVLWTGSAAHAAEALDCGDVASSTAGHFEGDRDQVPADSDKATPHHHSACHGHCTAVPSGAESVELDENAAGLLEGAMKDVEPGTHPDMINRPPIA